MAVRSPPTDVPNRVRNEQRQPQPERDPEPSRHLHGTAPPGAIRPSVQAAVLSRDLGAYLKSFGVGIRARIRSSSSTVTRSSPSLRQDSSTALMTIPRTNAGTFFMRVAAASSQAIVGGDSPPYSIIGGASPKPRRGEDGPEPFGPRSMRSGDAANFPGVWVQRGSS